MKKNILFTAVLYLTLTAMSFGQKVTANFDGDADFSKYKTVAFIGWQDGSETIVNDIDKKRLYAAIESEFKLRDLAFVDSGGDIALSLYIVIDQKTSTTAYTNYYGGMGYGGYGRTRYGGMGWGGGASTTTYHESDYLVGTVVFDVYDESTQKLVWQGVSTGTLKDPKKREKSIPKGVAKLMKKFPVKPVK